MKTDSLNTERDWQELQETNSRFIVLDSNDLIVSCNDKVKHARLDLHREDILPSDCFWLDADQRTFCFNEFKEIAGKEIKLLFMPSGSEARRVKVLVEAFQLFNQQYYSLLIQDEHVEFVQNEYVEFDQGKTHPFYGMAQALSADLKNSLLELHYQPQINTVDNSLYGVEVLARWTSDEFGSVTPDRFVALAEEFGLIAELDLWVLRQSCLQLASWRDRGIHIPMIAVNFSPLSFNYPSLKNEIQALLDQTGLLASSLVIEVTESKKIKTSDLFIDAINDLHSIGVIISLDDFGTGYSNLKRLLKFPVSQLKLDRAFVSDLPNKLSKELSAVVLSISKKIGAVAIAEGVETQQQLSCLKSMGYEVVQGYIFSPPLSKSELEHWFYAVE
ncbi:EAL domain, c-di-GMP-specific phosphodiesterase class I (or its enzymatically inactive variant) [Marinomonas polaris DSM 16579]|uniref:EAL domain, c-di-GMP-specific phosphodiesterase class I (Or its enzymatically inactive variant) n=1 Tax=Marinomonas polaris DSM 16579 TaxID=1122206 RepID=A0A1M5IBR9_9GAMM|nr:EAL domain-containing protein [Marinomonas polaris]SHG25701.1 EAL domain, c-di-GMP-specific phosphodiesterase class I (or its enzymatically inactive variant) [Marinomonas polaris DSM 16579]